MPKTSMGRHLEVGVLIDGKVRERAMKLFRTTVQTGEFLGVFNFSLPEKRLSYLFLDI